MNKQATFALRGTVVHAKDEQSIQAFENHFVVCEQGVCAGVFKELPDKFKNIDVQDVKDKLIIPGLVDLHLHAPQYAFRALGMDLELLEWLDTCTFPQEAKYADEAYADKAYTYFVNDLAAGGTTRACIFGTMHVPATLLLMEKLEKTGLQTLVGKVNMDRNSNEDLQEESAQASLLATQEWIDQSKARFKATKPMLTPRFIPSCSDALMRGLAVLQQKEGLCVQSHLSENASEVDWVAQLCPESDGYADAYDRFGMFGGSGCPTIMAHCVHNREDEIELMHKNNVFVAHCPGSNANLSSGVAPVRKFLQAGVPVGLGTDIAGGFALSVFRAMADAVQFSKLRWCLEDNSLAPLTIPEVFYLATRGGGAFFGKVGGFDAGFEFDALVLDDSMLPCPFALTPQQRLERVIYLGGDGNVVQKYCAGVQVK